MAMPETGGKNAALATAPGEAAFEIIFAPLKYGEAPRVLFLGDSRCGKTEIMRRAAVEYTRREANGLVLVADDKDPYKPQFEGQYFRDPAELESPAGIARLKPDPRIVVFRGDPDNDSADGLFYESVATFQWKMRKRGRRSLAIYDELDRAAKNGQWINNPSKIAWSYGKGGSAGVGSFAGTQETEAVPPQPFNQATCVVVVRMMGNPLRLLKQRNYCVDGVDSVIARLPGTELPPPQRGYFVVLERGRPWNRRVYRFSTPAPKQKA